MSPEPQDNDELGRLDELNKRLYSQNPKAHHYQRFDSLHPKHVSAKSDWAPPPEPKDKLETVKTVLKHPSFFKKFFFFSLGFAGLAVVIALFTFFSGGNTVSSNNIDISVLGNSFAAGGEQVPLQVEVVNKNATALELADLFVSYEKGGDASGGAGLVNDLNSLGTIDAGQSSTQNIFVTLYGEEGSTKAITFTLQYRIAGSNAIFVKTTTFPITLSSAPIELSVDSPQNLSPNQTLSFTVKVKSNAKDPVQGMLLHVDYPSGFQFEKATPDPSALDDTWDLGDLPPGAERDVTITGTVFGTDGEDRVFHIYTGAASDTDKTVIGVTYNSLLQTVSLVKPFIEADLSINASTDSTVSVPSNGIVNVSVNWANNLPTEITDAEISVALSGNALNTSSVVAPNGFYDSSTNTIVWNQTTDSDLATVQPSDHGQVSFSFSPSALWSAGQSLIAAPTIQLSVSIKGKQPAEGGAESEVTNFEQKTVNVSSDLGFSAQAFYNNGPFTNTGPLPPQANQPTTYTVTWTVTNSSNALDTAVATTTLPTYVDWVGTTAPSGELITYDDTTRTVSWNIGSVAPGTGLSGASRTASFQVRFTPSTSQVGSTPKLTLDTSVSARDTFTSQTLSASRPPLSIQLENDTGFPAGGAVVTQ